MKERLSIYNITLIALIISYFVIVGAEIFGHIVVSGTAFEEPPRSLSMFEGEFGYDSQSFWYSFPLITAMLFVITIAVHWKTDRQNLLLIAFAGFVIIGIVSTNFIYPQFLDVVSTGYSDTFDPELQNQAKQFTRLALIRLTATIGFGTLLLLGLTIPIAQKERSDIKTSTAA